MTGTDHSLLSLSISLCVCECEYLTGATGCVVTTGGDQRPSSNHCHTVNSSHRFFCDELTIHFWHRVTVSLKHDGTDGTVKITCRPVCWDTRPYYYRPTKL